MPGISTGLMRSSGGVRREFQRFRGVGRDGHPEAEVLHVEPEKIEPGGVAVHQQDLLAYRRGHRRGGGVRGGSQMPPHGLDQARRPQRFTQIIVETDVERPGLLHIRQRAGEGQDRDCGRTAECTEPAEQPKPIHARQREIQKDQVRKAGRRDFQSRFAVVGLQHPEAGAGQGGLRPILRGGIRLRQSEPLPASWLPFGRHGPICLRADFVVGRTAEIGASHKFMSCLIPVRPAVGVVSNRRARDEAPFLCRIRAKSASAVLSRIGCWWTIVCWMRHDIARSASADLHATSRCSGHGILR